MATADTEQPERESALSLSNRALLARLDIMQRAGLAYGGNRDYYETLGYNLQPDATEYRVRWERDDIAERIVNLPASMCWRERPDIVDRANVGSDDEAETEFEEAVETLFDEFQLLHYLERWDKAIGLGRFGLLFIGLAESTDVDPDRVTDAQPTLDEPAEEGAFNEDDLAYFSVFTESSVNDINTVKNPMHERFGLPLSYDLDMDTGDVDFSANDVHYTRVLHAAEEVLDNEIYGKSRLKSILNRLDDRKKILGGAAEAYWRSADRRIHLDYQGDSKPADADEVAEQAEEMIHGLKGVLTTQNTEMTAIEGSDPDPTGALDGEMQAIAGARGIPKRILTGSERGELASTQDKANLAGRYAERQSQFCEPMMLRPLLDRLVDLGVLPEPSGDGYEVEWQPLFELNEIEMAELMRTKAEALANSAANQPFQVATVPEIREQILEWNPERGEETSLDPEEDPERIVDEEPDEEDIDDFDEIIEDIGDVDENGDVDEDDIEQII